MQFEHLVEINDPGNPMIPVLTRRQVWAGLLRRAEDPVPFLPGLQRCTVLARGAGGLDRLLAFQGADIRDRVTWEEDLWMRFAVTGPAEHAGSTLTITLEEPAPGHLFLRFAYRTRLGESSGDPDASYAEFVKSAYHESDVDTVRMIRVLAMEPGKPQ